MLHGSQADPMAAMFPSTPLELPSRDNKLPAQQTTPTSLAIGVPYTPSPKSPGKSVPEQQAGPVFQPSALPPLPLDMVY